VKYLPLIWAGLWRKPLRTSLTMLSLVAAFLLFGLLQGINDGFSRIVETARMDRLIIQPRFFDIQMPVAYKQQIESVAGVSLVGYQSFLNGYYQDPKKYFFVGAADENYLTVYPEIKVTDQQRQDMKSTRNAVLVSPMFANRLGVTVGQSIPVKARVAKKDGSNDWAFELAGLVDREDNAGAFQFSFGNYEYFNEERTVGKNTVSQFVVRISDPEQGMKIAAAIDTMFASSGAPTRTQVEQLAMQSNMSGLNDFKLFVNATVIAVLFTLLLLTANTMMQSFRERIPEMAVLKTLGFSDRKVLMMVLAESLTQCLAGAAIGLAFARLLSPVIKSKLPQPLNVLNIPLSIIVLGLVTAIAVAFISAALPAWRAGRLQIVDALAGR
jgi:putative ABC transport system permease protein